MTIKPPDTDAPFCSNCGYVLTGLTESSKCPECGRPIVEVLTRPTRFPQTGKRYRSQATIFGMPVLDIALGPKNGEMRGRARGFFAIGDIATGIVAIGGLARGAVALGGVCVGAFSLGGVSVGLLTAMGGCALGGIALGGVAIGVVATGGVAIGVIATGAPAIGWCARGPLTVGPHRLQPGLIDPLARDWFERLGWLVGGWPQTPVNMLRGLVIPFAATTIAIILAGITALVSSRNSADEITPSR